MLRLKNDFKDRHRVEKFFSAVVLKAGQLPSHMVINNVQKDDPPHVVGSVKQIWRGRQGKKVVAIKVRDSWRPSTTVSGVFDFAEILLI